MHSDAGRHTFWLGHADTGTVDGGAQPDLTELDSRWHTVGQRVAFADCFTYMHYSSTGHNLAGAVPAAQPSHDGRTNHDVSPDHPAADRAVADDRAVDHRAADDRAADHWDDRATGGAGSEYGASAAGFAGTVAAAGQPDRPL